MGQYVVSATATGADPDGFVLTNTERPSLVVTTNLDEMDDTDGLTSLREAIAMLGPFETPGLMAAASEFIFEGLHLHQKLNKDRQGGRFAYHA